MDGRRRAVARVPLFKGVADLDKIVRSVGERGFVSSTRRIVKALRDRRMHELNLRFDRRFNVRTEEKAIISKLTIVDGDKRSAENYAPMHVALFPSVMSVLPDDLSEFVFIDFGAGKGRVALLASDYNFKRIIGVEFARELHEAMLDNIREYRNSRQRCHDLVTSCQDARHFDIPNEKCVFFFFNPFKMQILQEVASKIAQSYFAAPRKMYILFYNPTSENRVREIFASLGFLKQRSLWSPTFHVLSPYDLAIYESAP
jgi:predicted RNA methylase